ncbi:MAG: FAD-binding protein [Treponema sp.]|jgi:electron transfer flavoprotein alpha subunit|nr:FAD-binding protein [Treponema sp.]
MTIAFVLRDRADSAASLLWDFIVPVYEAGDRVQLWLLGLWDIRCAEGCLRWLEELCAARRPDLILLPETLANHELGARLAVRLNRGCFPETTTLLREGGRVFARKKACGSNLDWDVEIVDYPAILTVVGKKTARPAEKSDYSRIESRSSEPLTLPHWILAYEQTETLPANPLETAPLIFVAGRGMESKGACDRLRRVAGCFGAPLGFSRPAALNGWGEIADIIGQSGVRIGAKVCVAVGVSGAAAFMAGIDTTAALIAVNPDKNAPIFHYADVGIVSSAEEFIDALEMETSK